jgi:hypothetical protein
MMVILPAVAAHPPRSDGGGIVSKEAESGESWQTALHNKNCWGYYQVRGRGS